jgi:hypothetical protein
MADELDDLADGDRLTIGGVVYAVTHVKVDGRRGDISLIALDEARRRRDDLNALLDEDGV